jgi:hypothetical protein
MVAILTEFYVRFFWATPIVEIVESLKITHHQEY